MKLRTGNPKDALKYKVHFLPTVTSPQRDVWQVSGKVRYEYRELGVFIQDCIDVRRWELEASPHLTKDRETLLGLLECLSTLLPDTMPVFVPPKKIPLPSNINEVSNHERRSLLEKIKRENSDSYRTARESHEKRAQAFMFRRRIVPGLRSAIESISDGETKDIHNRYGIPVQPLNWRILPRGKHPFAEIIEYFNGLKRNSYHNSYEYDIERIRKIYSLQETDVYVGIGEFESYVVFDHSRYGFAILDCPIVGNAVYLIKGDWRVLSTLSKRDLLELHRDETLRIVHSGDWFPRLKMLFNTLMPSTTRRKVRFW